MGAKAKILGRGTDEVVLVGCLPVVTQAHCGNPVLGPEDSMRGRTGTESLLLQSLCSTREESCQTNVTERRILLVLYLILKTPPPAVERDFGISNRMRVD